MMIPVTQLIQTLEHDSGKAVRVQDLSNVVQIPVVNVHDREVSEVMTEVAEDYFPGIAGQFLTLEGA